MNFLTSDKLVERSTVAPNKPMKVIHTLSSPENFLISNLSHLTFCDSSSYFWWTFFWTFFCIHAFSYKQCYFSHQPQCCLTFSWIELQMLLMSRLLHKGHHTETFVSLSRSRSIYAVSVWSIFNFNFYFHYTFLNLQIF